MRYHSYLVIIPIIVFLNGCATVPQGVSPSTSPLIASDGKVLKYESVGQGEGKAGHFNLFGFIPFGKCDLNAAIAQAIQKKNGDNLINAHFYVKQTSYLIFGNYTTFIVKGDVIKYAEKPSIEPISPVSTPVQDVPSLPLALSHRLSVSPFSEFGSEYTLILDFNKPFFASASLGYRYVVQEVEQDFFGSKFTFRDETQVIPLTINVGVNGAEYLSRFLNRQSLRSIPINPYASGGIGYYPTVGGNWSVLIFGWNLTLGAEYAISPNFMMGAEMKFYRTLYDNRSDGFFFVNENLSFNNFGLTIRFIP